MKNSSDPLVRVERRNDKYAQGWKEAVGEEGEYPWKKSGIREKGGKEMGMRRIII